MTSKGQQNYYTPSPGGRFMMAMSAAQRRRPISFYLLVLIPVVLILGVYPLNSAASPRSFLFYCSLILFFLWLVSALAINDFIALFRKHRCEQRQAYRDTLGDPDFVDLLGNRVRSRLKDSYKPKA
ncbi:MAG: hypothetical protein GX117_05440 [Candidatus Hydrogenedentes bacterium]|jgi:hypothetical protein|nr:hypothetical protein [Candidatus Hydrogenedentota bacterium]